MSAEVRSTLHGRRVLITGAARGIGAELAQRLHQRGAHVALLGLEAEQLSATAHACGDAPWRLCDVTDREHLGVAVDELVAELGGLDVVVANAGVASALPLIGGDWRRFEQTMAVNVLGTYYTVDAAGPYVSHDDGYILLISSLAARIQLPLLGAYSASKAAVAALGNALRMELRPTGAKVGVAFFGELDTEMTSRGFSPQAVVHLLGKAPLLHRVAPVELAIDAVEQGITHRRSRVVAPGWIRSVLVFPQVAQALADRVTRGRVARALELSRAEASPLTTTQTTRLAPEPAGADEPAATRDGKVETVT